MSSKLGTLTLDLVARIGQFVAPMEEARETATEATSEIEEGFTTAGLAAKAFGAILAGLSVGAVYDYVNSLMEAGDQLSSFSKLANASVEQFQYYAKGAASAGISMEQFADQMKDMQDRIGDFQQSGGGPLADFFENIAPLVGVTIQQFQKLSGPEALQLFYDSLQKVGATENDIKFYMESIIGDSSKLIPLLENGGEGFKKWGDNAVAAGSIVSESTANALAGANESVQLMMESWTGFKVEMAENVAPVITTVIDNFDTVKAVAIALGAAIATKLVIQLGILSIEFIKGVVEGVRYQMALAAMAGQTITLTSATAALRTAMWSLVGGPAGLAILAVQVLAAGAAFLYMKKASDEVKPSLNSQSLSIKELIADFENLSEAARRSQLRFEDNKLSDLSDSYDDAKSKLISLVISMGRFDDSSGVAIKTANALAMQYKQGDITAEQLASKINALTGASNEAKTKIDGQAVAVAKVKAEMDKQQQVTDALTNKNGQLANSHDQITTSVNAQTSAYQSLTKKQSDALKGINSDLEKDKYVSTNMALGWSREKADFYADYRSTAGLGFTGNPLSQLELQTVEQSYKLQQSTKAREESEKKIEETQKKQLENQKNQQKILNINDQVRAQAAKYNFTALEAAEGIPKGTLSAIMMQESRGNNSVTGPMTKYGTAKGGFQFLDGTAKQYGVTNAYDGGQSSKAASKYIGHLLRTFNGDLEKAIRAYHAGEGNVQKGKGMGPINDDYWEKYVARMAGINGIEAGTSAKDWEKSISEDAKFQEQTLENQQSIRATYYTAWEQLESAHNDRVAEIKKNFAEKSPEYQILIDKEKEFNAKQIEEWLTAQDARVDAERKANQEIIVSRQLAYNAINNPLNQMQQMGLDATAKVSMTPEQYKKWQLNNEQQDGYSHLSSALGETQTGIKDNLLLSDQEKYAQLTKAYDQYLQSKSALDVQYDQQFKDLAQSQRDEQLSLLSGILSNTQTTFAQLTQSAKDGAGEQSTIYRTMFAMQQGFSVASSLVAAWTAYTQAFADPSAMTLPQKFLGATSVMAALAPALATISSVSITGMAHDGIDNIPKEGTWLLDKGERVVDSRTNSDLKNYLADGGGYKAPNVNVYTLPGQTADVSWNDGELDVRIRKVAGEYLDGQLSNPNSQTSKTMKQNFNVAQRR